MWNEMVLRWDEMVVEGVVVWDGMLTSVVV